MKRMNRLPLAVLLLAASCNDSTPAPNPPAPFVKSPPSARAPQSPSPSAATPLSSAPASSTTNQTPRADAAAQKLSTAQSDPKIVEIAGLVMPKPVAWQWQAPSMQFRALQYSVPGSAEGAGAAEVVFSVFAAGDGGPIDANVKRWVSQFRSDDGGEASAKIEDRMVGAFPVKWIELAGHYQGMGQAAPRPGMAQLGAIVQAPNLTLFIRLVGPAPTIETSRADFEAMVAGIRAAQ